VLADWAQRFYRRARPIRRSAKHITDGVRPAIACWRRCWKAALDQDAIAEAIKERCAPPA
jgi:hypothetical protein